MKKTVYLLFLILLEVTGFAQVNKFPNGIYLNLEQLKKQTPVFDLNFHIIKRTPEDIAINGGNDYKFKSNIDSIDKHYIKKTIFAYVKDDSIFLNCVYLKLETWYALSLTKGNFLAFKASMTNSQAGAVSATGGLIGGLIGGAIVGAITSEKRYLYVLSLRTGNVKRLKKEYLIERLKENPILLEQFNQEKEQESETTLIKYISLLNETISPSSTIPSK